MAPTIDLSGERPYLRVEVRTVELDHHDNDYRLGPDARKEPTAKTLLPFRAWDGPLPDRPEAAALLERLDVALLRPIDSHRTALGLIVSRVVDVNVAHDGPDDGEPDPPLRVSFVHEFLRAPSLGRGRALVQDAWVDIQASRPSLAAAAISLAGALTGIPICDPFGQAVDLVVLDFKPAGPRTVLRNCAANQELHRVLN